LPATRAGRRQRQLKPDPDGAEQPPPAEEELWPAAKVETTRRAGLPQVGQGRAGSGFGSSFSKVTRQSGQEYSNRGMISSWGAFRVNIF
jgi:hypothetical protein